MAQPSPTSEGVLVAEDGPTELDEGSDGLTKVAIERLGRERPAVFSSAYVEAGFIMTIVISTMMSEYFISGFNIILPGVAVALSVPQSARTWPAAVPNLTTAALLLPFARMCSMYGGRMIFLGGHCWLLVWSLVSGFSQNSAMIIVCRAMQGIGFAAYLPAGLALLGQAYRPGPRKNFVYSLYGAFACVGFYFGIIIGGVAAEMLDWRWYFWIGTVLCFVVVVSGLITIPRGLDDTDTSARMDWWGVCTIVPGVLLVVFAFTDGGNAPQGWRTPYIYITLILGSLFLGAAVYTQGWVSAQPLLPADLFRPKYMKRLVASLFCCYGVFGLFLFYASFYLETVLHTTPLQTAVWFTPFAVGGMILAIGGGMVLHILSGRALMIVSGVGFLVSVLLFAIIPAQSDLNHPSNTFLYWAYVFPAMVCGTIGVDITFNVTNVFITTAMPKRHQAAAGGLINSLLFLGISFWLGIAELAISSTLSTQGAHAPGLRGQYQIGFWTGVGLSVLSLCLTATVRMGQAASDMTADEKETADEQEKARLGHLSLRPG